MKLQKLFNKAKTIIKEVSWMKFYDETKVLYLEGDASGVGLEVRPLQIRDRMSCPKSKAQNNAILSHSVLPARTCQVLKGDTTVLRERGIRNTRQLRKVPPSLLCKRDISMNYRSLVAILMIDVAILSQTYMHTAEDPSV